MAHANFLKDLSEDNELYVQFRWMQTIEEGRKLIKDKNNQSNQ